VSLSSSLLGHVTVGGTLYAHAETLKAGGSAAWTVVSDARLKTAVRDFPLGIDELMRLRPRLFQYNGLGGTTKDGQTYVGLVAQELPVALAPYCMLRTHVLLHPSDTVPTEIMMLDHSAFPFLCINGLQEHEHRLRTLETVVLGSSDDVLCSNDGGSLQTTGCPLHHDGYQHTLTLPPWSRTRGQGPWEPWSRTWALQLAALTASVLIGCCTATPSTAGPWPHGPSTGLAPSYSSDSGLVNLLSEASGLVNLLSEARPALLHATTAATLLATLWSLWSVVQPVRARTRVGSRPVCLLLVLHVAAVLLHASVALYPYCYWQPPPVPPAGRATAIRWRRL